MKDIQSLQRLLSDAIGRLDFGQEPKELYEPVSYMLSLGGKRMRPLLVLLGSQIFDEEVESYVKPALAVEVFHNFTLMHDDIMDQAPLRRGKETVHMKWNNSIAILSGDAMLIKAYDLLLGLEPDLLRKVIARFNSTAIEVCEGQQLDMNFENQLSVTVEDYLSMIRFKTAVLLGFSLEMGAIMAGGSEEECQKLYSIGVDMGMGFQLMDDLLDIYGDQEKFGKQVGGDIVSNKKTFLLIKARELAQGKQREELDHWMGKEQFVAEKKVQKIREIYDELNIPDWTKSKMNDYFNRSFERMDQLTGNNEGIGILRQFALQLIHRES